MKLRYTVSYEVVFDVPDHNESSYSNLDDELGAIAESGISMPKLGGWVIPTGTKIIELNKHGHEFWGEVSDE